MRNKIFISHATPDDNDFTKWLALKLIGIGYEVWCDLLFLEKGIDFWVSIEKEIRENSIKFLLVSSSASNQRVGVLKEVAVAEKVKKLLKDDTFIIPLSIDEKLSYDDINIDIVRLNAIDFKRSWANGLRDLLEFLERKNIPRKSSDQEKSNLLYQQIFLHDKCIIDKNEIYDSNWFSILSFPEELRFHEFNLQSDFDIRELKYPAIRYRNYLCTFAWEYDFITQLPETETYASSKTIRIPTSKIFSDEYTSNFINKFEAQRLIVQIINKAFELRMKDKKISEYKMSNKIGYWIRKGVLDKDKFNKVQLVGKLKGTNWHFGISGAAKLYPLPVLMISSHIFFTHDGENLIESKSTQHTLRRRQGRNWWNDIWRSKLLSFVFFLSDDNTSFYLEAGSEEKIYISNKPIQFMGKVSYNTPDKNCIEEEKEIDTLMNFDEFDTEYTETVEGE